MVKKTAAKLDAYGLFLPSRMGASISQEVLLKGLKLAEIEAEAEEEGGDGDEEVEVEVVVEEGSRRFGFKSFHENQLETTRVKSTMRAKKSKRTSTTTNTITRKKSIMTMKKSKCNM